MSDFSESLEQVACGGPAAQLASTGVRGPGMIALGDASPALFHGQLHVTSLLKSTYTWQYRWQVTETGHGECGADRKAQAKLSTNAEKSRSP